MSGKGARTLPIEVDAAAHPPLGMPTQRFLRDYWQKRPLLIRNAFPDFRTPLAPEDLAGLACEPAALARVVRHDREHDAWRVDNGPFEESYFPALPDRDWTLLVQDVDKWDDDVRALLRAFDFLPRWRVDDVMVSFAAPGGSVGAHVDQYDVFLLQAQGTRRWQIDVDTPRDPAFRDDVELKLLRSFEPTHAWDVRPGDMLYLPPGVAHNGVAVDACLTCSIGMRAPSRAELLVDAIEMLAERLPESERYADPDLAAPEDPCEIDDAALARVASALQPLALERDALRDWFGRFITRYRSAGDVAPPPRVPSFDVVQERLLRGATLRRHPLTRMAWTRAGRGAALFVSGERFDTSAATARRLCAQETIDGDDCSALDANARELLHDLLRRGHYALTRTPRPR